MALYVVEYGDTPAGIAQRLGVAWEDVVRLNPILQISPTFVYQGLALTVPATRPRTVTPVDPGPAVRPRYVNPPTTNTTNTNNTNAPPKDTKTFWQLLGLDKLSEKDKQTLTVVALGFGGLLLVSALKD